MNSLQMIPFSANFARQMINVQKSFFEIYASTAYMLEDQAKDIITSTWRQHPFTHGENESMNDRLSSLNEWRRSLRHAVREGFELLEQMVMPNRDGNDTPDVLLDVPTLDIDKIKLDLEDLEARVSLKARLADLVQIDVGAHAEIEKLELDICGVEAQALLKVRLEQVAAIFSRALETLDRNSDLISGFLEQGSGIAGEAGEEISGVAGKTGESVKEDNLSEKLAGV